MTHFIRVRNVVECFQYGLFFPNPNDPHSGCEFDCDEHGNVDLAKLEKEKPAAYANWLKCHAEGRKSSVKTYRWHYTEPAAIKCACGCEVELDHYTNTCDSCERDYNMSGQELAPRQYWGEETGEHPSECF